MVDGTGWVIHIATAFVWAVPRWVWIISEQLGRQCAWEERHAALCCLVSWLLMEKVWTIAMFFWESGQDSTARAVGVREPLAAMPWALGQIRTQLSALDWKAAG